MRTLFIGADGKKVVDSKTTQEQIHEVERLHCRLTENGEPLTWPDLDNPNEPRTLFQAILRDRKMRVDDGIFMADRPAFAVVTAIGEDAVRLEYYEGHDALSLIYDLRAPELASKSLPAWLEKIHKK
jgi:hypothetical protein